MALTPGERLNLIKQLIVDLAADEWGEIELTLDTFGVAPPGRDSDSREDYVRTRLKHSSDDALVALHAHLHPDISLEIAPTAGGPWQERYVKLFLTHTHPNKVLAKAIRDRLLLYGIDTFVAHEMIEPSKEWREEIELALATCEALAALVTKDLVASKYCDQEIGFAMGRGLVVIPIRQETDPHGFFGKYQGAPGAEGPYAAHVIANGIFDALVTNPKTKGKMGSAIIRRYTTSRSYDNARENTQYLIDMPQEMWTDEMVKEVEEAGSENSQLEDGVWIPTQQRIPDFVSEHLDKMLNRSPKSSASGTFDFSDFAPSAAADDDIPF